MLGFGFFLKGSQHFSFAIKRGHREVLRQVLARHLEVLQLGRRGKHQIARGAVRGLQTSLELDGFSFRAGVP